MRSTTARFRAAVAEPHRIAVLAEIVTADVVSGTVVDIVEGSVTLDQQAAVRGRCDLTIVDDGTLGLVPEVATSLLAPYGNEIRLSRGVLFADGTSELVGLGVFRIQDTEVSESPEGTQLRISGLDRAARIADARFEEPYQIPAGTNYATAIRDVLLVAYPSIVMSFEATTLTTPMLIAQEGDDRWAFVQQMATAISMNLYFDGDGTCVLASQSPTGAVASIAEGDGGVLITAGRRWTREGAFNRVIATGENSGESTPARGVATDEDPNSPTWYEGPFGKAPRFYVSSFITTDAQAQSAAQSILSNELGTTQQVNFGSYVLPHLEPRDTVRITRLRAGIDEDHVLDSLTIPLSPTGSMEGQTRARQVTS